MTLFGIHFEPVSWQAVAALAAALATGWCLLRLIGGAPVRIARRWDLLLLRLAIVLVLIVILAGPLQVDESQGEIRRPDVFYLLDASQSMGIGTSSTRWEDAGAAIRAAAGSVQQPDALGSVHPYRFGHRLAALDARDPTTSGRSGQDESRGTPADASASQVYARDAVRTAEGGPAESPGPQTGGPGPGATPTDTDSRLADALRQLTSRFGRTPPAGVVLFSDGRVRDPAAVEELARYYGDKRVPVHVYPVGGTASGGDIALVSIVAPQQVRKFSTVDVQVFLRSFGYEGRRAEVKIVADTAGGGPERVLATQAITLRGGVQPVALTYRSDIRSEEIKVRIEKAEDEISTRNNEVAASVAIERTKVRVLYLEGSSEQTRVVRTGDQYEYIGPYSAIQQALVEDEDIECVVLTPQFGTRKLQRVQSPQSTTVARGFPDTQAELAAFDAVILSNISRSSLDDEQLEWLETWVNGRGGGLCMLGGPDSFASGGWHESPLARMLPVEFAAESWSPADQVALATDSLAASHAVWSILADRQRNREILGELPAFQGLNRGLAAKPACDVLARSAAESGAAAPVLVCGAYGRGRTLAMSVPATAPWAAGFLNRWGPSGNQYSGKFWRNLVYWLTENSTIGRRRLVTTVDKQFYQPGETIELSAVAYDETAAGTTDYTIMAMVEPRSLDFDDESLYSSVRWPNGVPRTSGENGPYIAWGEEFELPRNTETGRYVLPLQIAERLRSGTDNQGLRIELTAYENTSQSAGGGPGTQVDSTSLEVQIIDDPFEQQNPFPNHDLLARVASLSGGTVLRSPAQLAGIIDELPISRGPPVVRKAPLWSNWWLLGTLIALLSVEWFRRRSLGLA